MTKTVLIKVREETRHRLKKEALENKLSMIDFLDVVSKNGFVKQLKKISTVSLKENSKTLAKKV